MNLHLTYKSLKIEILKSLAELALIKKRNYRKRKKGKKSNKSEKWMKAKKKWLTCVADTCDICGMCIQCKYDFNNFCMHERKVRLSSSNLIQIKHNVCLSLNSFSM